MFEGCTPNTRIGLVETWTNIEYLPTESYLTVVPQEMVTSN